MITDFLDNRMPDPQYGASNLQSPLLATHHLSSNIEWSSMSLESPSFHLNQMGQDGHEWFPQPELERNAADITLLQLPGNNFLDNTPLTSCSSLQMGDHNMSDEVAQDSLPPSPERRTLVTLRHIESKPINTPLKTLGRIDSKIFKGKGPRKGGRRHGLSDEQREGAALMRKTGACLMCAMDKQKVPWKRIPESRFV